jgi:hypothetical protein
MRLGGGFSANPKARLTIEFSHASKGFRSGLSVVNVWSLSITQKLLCGLAAAAYVADFTWLKMAIATRL